MEDDMQPDPTHGLSDDELADLARLADGTLPPDRRAEVEARVAASPQLASLVERQGIALAGLRATADTGAPARLRSHVERRAAGRTARTGRRPMVLGGALAGAAVVALALALVLPGGLSGGPSVADAAALAERPPTQPAPAGVPSTPQLLRAEADGVPFPNYAAKFGWTPVGARRDETGGRGATTVYYEKHGRRVAYTIVAGDALDRPADARSTRRGGVEYRRFRDDGRTVVTWEREGHTCVLSGEAVPPGELLALADWRGKGAIRF
jgi:anti-sigma factor RsiW